MSAPAVPDWLRQNVGSGLPTDDVLALILPLLRQVAGWHDEGRVAPLDGLVSVVPGDDGGLSCAGDPMDPRRDPRVEAAGIPVSSALQVIGHTRVTSDDVEGTDVTDLDVVEADEELSRPAYVVGFRSWESLMGHHDALTDIFCLGQLLASLSTGLDFADREDLVRFSAGRGNLFRVVPGLHPVIASVIVEMTELNRHRRAPDLTSLIERLATYREQTQDVDLGRLAREVDGKSDRRKLVQVHLRDRLFEISRRNRLLYFRPSQASVNLTVASVPLVVNLTSVRLEQLFVWHAALAGEVIAGKPLNLGRWLRFEDQRYLPGALDRLISDARRDRAEYGFSQLRLVVAFLHWHNLKESPQERIVSPLLLLPVALSRKKGVRDQYLLDPSSTEAEVNPALRHHLAQVYGLHLPESVDLAETPLEEFHQAISAQIRATEPGVTLNFVDKPEIQLIQQRARQRLAQFERRQRLRTPAKRSKSSFSYSYDRENFRPLGLQLFREKVEPSELPQRLAAGGQVAPRSPGMVGESTETERQTFALREERPANPYSWDFDLCSITVGNFHYRKMSLVRDYGALLDEEFDSESFDQVFSADPRKWDEEAPAPLARAEQWSVVPGDATQTAAVALARTGASFIIQGPPGTGKSQTITNLIADYVACGKRVLFVCEKRAAIDVVFHRLRQQGLDELCCLIHDSQSDKKAFVLNLKQSYEKWLADADRFEAAERDRKAVITRVENDIEALTRFDRVMRSVPDRMGVFVRELLHRLVTLKHDLPIVTPGEAESLPNYGEWVTHGDLARRLAETLQDVADCESLAEHPFRRLSSEVIRSERPLERLRELANEAEAMIDEIEAELDGLALPAGLGETLSELESMVALAVAWRGLASRGQLDLLVPSSPIFARLRDVVARLAEADRIAAEAAGRTGFWREKLSQTDLTAAIAEARASEQSWMRFFKPSWWRLKRVVAERYDFSRHAIRPKYLTILNDLDAEFQSVAARDSARRDGVLEFGSDPVEVLAAVTGWQSDGKAGGFRAYILAADNGGNRVERLAALADPVKRLGGVVRQSIDQGDSLGLAEISETVRDLREEADGLPDFLPLLGEMLEVPEKIQSVLRRFALRSDQMEAAVAQNELNGLYREERWLPRFDGRMLEHRAGRIARLGKDLLEKNALAIRSAVEGKFRDHVRRSALPAGQLDAEGKKFKKTYSAGRRELEHEFGKSMRYRSIRELAAGASGEVVRDLKPIWLMSPLSVSDSLPLDTKLFDVVIFDEASQVPVEEAVPAIYRARQVIVVGDEMQLPPTSFFSAARDEEDEMIESVDGGERVTVALDADSFLTQCAKNLPATLLAWHYRSRSE